jgi:hypothetical protein
VRLRIEEFQKFSIPLPFIPSRLGRVNFACCEVIKFSLREVRAAQGDGKKFDQAGEFAKME